MSGDQDSDFEVGCSESFKAAEPGSWCALVFHLLSNWICVGGKGILADGPRHGGKRC